jgi:hypothetical protein
MSESLKPPIPPPRVVFAEDIYFSQRILPMVATLASEVVGPQVADDEALFTCALALARAAIVTRELTTTAPGTSSRTCLDGAKVSLVLAMVNDTQVTPSPEPTLPVIN